MRNILLIGGPGSGKGTLGNFFSDVLKVAHISTGELFRFHMSNETEIGLEVKEAINAGGLAKDEVTVSMLSTEMDRILDGFLIPDGVSFAFDGFPRTVPQAEALDALLAEKNTSVDLMVALSVPEEELVKRLLERGKDSGRSDDTDPEIVRNRISVYNEQTAVAANYYKNQNKFFEINGVGAVDHIFSEICGVVDSAIA